MKVYITHLMCSECGSILVVQFHLIAGRTFSDVQCTSQSCSNNGKLFDTPELNLSAVKAGRLNA
jgi:hypothetical protein